MADSGLGHTDESSQALERTTEAQMVMDAFRDNFVISAIAFVTRLAPHHVARALVEIEVDANRA